MTSPRTAARISRILSMLPWVIANPGVSVDEVCRRFGYSPRELTEDLNVVLVCGLPGYGPGELIDAYIDEDEVVVDVADYFSSSPRLTPAEGLGLMAAGMALLSAGSTSESLQRGVEKLQRTIIGDATDAVAVDIPQEPEVVPILRDAVRANETVQMTYTSLGSGETTHREVEPWQVFSSLGNWYLRAHCRLAGGERVFRVDRIRELSPGGNPFEPPPDPKVAEIGYSPGVDDTVAVLRLAPEARWVADYYPVDVVSDDEDGLTVRFSAASPRTAARLLLRLGRSGELIEGEEVRREVNTLRERLLTRYVPSPD